MKSKVVKRTAPKPLTPEERRGLEDVDELLKMLIRQNRQLHARVNRVAHAVTSLGEPEIDRLLKTLRKRLAAPKAGKVVATRRRARAA
jgi:hypothetical protein